MRPAPISLEHTAAGKGPAPRSRFPIGRAAFTVGVAVVIAYLQLKPSPSLDVLGLLPRSWVRFVNAQDFLNNVVGFGGFAAAVHFGFAGFRREPISHVVRRAACVAATMLVLEGAQVFYPSRSCDWRDVVAAWLGIALASLPWLRRAPANPSHDL